MNVQGYQKLTLLDFPGKVACTVFCGGCNLRCPFCHNATLVKEPHYYPNAQEEVLQYLSQRRGILDGVCVTGGEPLLQKDLADFFRKVKAMGYQTKLDTNGADPVRLKEVLSAGVVDYVAMDVKASFDNYARATGVDIPRERYQKSIDLIRSSGVDHEFRTTVVKGIHSDEDFYQIASLLAGEKKYFLQAFVDSGNLLENKGFAPFDSESMHRFLGIVRTKIPAASLRGQEE